MKLKGIYILFFVSILLVSCGSKRVDEMPDGFRSEVLLKTTPIKNQGQSSVSWCYAMLATIETEHLMQGDSVNISIDYLLRCYVRDVAEQYYKTKGKSELSMRGIGPMVPILLRRYGSLPYDSYYNTNPVNYDVLLRRVKNTASISMTKKKTTAEFMKDVDGILDHEIGYLPLHVFMLGAEYTPLEFAHSLCGKEEYQTLTTEENSDYSVQVKLCNNDNIMKCVGRNLPKNSILQYIKKSLSLNHPVMWTDDSQKYDPVAIVGIGRDSHGKEYFVGKNSKGKNNQTKGMLYIPTKYVREHTAFVVVKRYL